MSSFLIGLLFGVGVAGWSYSKLARRTGNANPSSTLIAAAGAGVVVTIFVFTLLKFTFGF